MKKMFIVLLIAAAGAGAYFYFSYKQKHSANNQQELIIGKWKIDSVDAVRSKDSSIRFVSAADSNLRKYEFEFDKQGSVIKNMNGTQDSSHYKFDDNDLLVWNDADTSKITWTINKLHSLNLVIQSKDSSVFSFRKIK